jgi:ribosomal protein S18 acetylase RimI-like enzyme
LDGLRPEDRLRGWEETVAATAWPRRGVLVLLAPEARAHRGAAPVVGFSSLGPSRDPDADAHAVGEIETIYLDPQAFGTGDGDVLMDATRAALVAGGYGSATLWMLETNDRARRFYLRHGWRLDGASKRHDWGAFVATDVRFRIDLR